MSPNLPISFWSRMGLPESDRDVCVRVIQQCYPEYCVEEVGDQGYCSFTLVVTPSTPRSSGDDGLYIVQIRPEQHSLDLDIADSARRAYGGLAPDVRTLDCVLPGKLKAVQMERLKGVPFSHITGREEGRTWDKQVRLVESFARFIAMGWPTCLDGAEHARRIRADTPTEGLWLEQYCTGKVGRQIVPKLRKLVAHLPDAGLRERSNDTLKKLLAIKRYPVVLNHGDLIPSNILVDEDSWEVTGLMDWAEAEHLPFGTCLYGLEHLLGQLNSTSWTYHDESDRLRSIFWKTLEREKPELSGRLNEVKVMRDVGVLLWLGFAWDEGRIDRVVNEVDDAEEITCLRAFLDAR